MAKAIIFGITGQDGFYLKELLQKCRIEVIGVSRSSTEHTIGNVWDCSFVSQLIKNTQPAYVFHLSANSTTRHEALWDNHKEISTGTLCILEAIRLFAPTAKVFISGSGAQFKNDGTAINENTSFECSSAYALSRIDSVNSARYYRSVFSLQVYVGYFFNHDSPLRTERHINKKIVNQVVSIATGSKEKIIIGDVTVEKEFTFAADTMTAVWILINQNNIYEAVIGSGLPYPIAHWLHLCFSYFNLSWQNHVVLNKEFVTQYQKLYCDPTVIKSLGWQQTTGIEQLARLMIENR